MIHLKSVREIDTIAQGGAIIAALFEELGDVIRPGVTTLEVDSFSEAFIRSHDGARAAFKGLYGFPGSVCISVNEEVVHGIPSARRVLAEGDIVSIDVGVKYQGWCSDSARTFPVGRIDDESKRLLTVTESALDGAVEACKVGGHIGDIGAAVMERVGDSGLGIIRDLVGHGVGREVHEDPQVPNIGRVGYGPRLQVGMVLAVEPMLSAGSDAIKTLDDRWTVVTHDLTRSAHFEHTVAVTESGPRILTQALEGAASAPPGEGVGGGLGG
jgi:methionyl aminopeptidase